MNRHWGVVDSTGVCWHWLSAPPGIWSEPSGWRPTLPARVPRESLFLLRDFQISGCLGLLMKENKTRALSRAGRPPIIQSVIPPAPFLSLPLNQNGRKPKHRLYTSIQSNEIRAFCIYLVNPETLQVFNVSFPEPQDEHKDKTGRVERHR